MNVLKGLMDVVKDAKILKGALSVFVLRDTKHIMMIQTFVLVYLCYLYVAIGSANQKIESHEFFLRILQYVGCAKVFLNPP